MHALVLNGQILKTSNFHGMEPPDLAENKGEWVPINEMTTPDYDTRIQMVNVATSITNSSVEIAKTVQDRPLADVQTEQIAALRQRTSDAILAEAPQYVQRNVGIGGIYSPEEEERVRGVIQTHRNACNLKEAAILAAATGQAVLDALV